MIGYLSGVVISNSLGNLIVDVNGVGYDVMIPERSAEGLSEGDEISLHINTNVREDAIDLYGFMTVEEKIFFQKIRGVHGIGPKSAMALMTFSLGELKDAIQTEDIKKLASVKGLGKKGVERLILELKDKLPDSVHEDRQHVAIKQDVYDALQNLGYRKKDIEIVLRHKPDQVAETEEIVKYFLQNL